MPRILVFISGPLSNSGNLDENVNNAVKAGVELAKAGLAPVIPHLSVFTAKPCNRYASMRDLDGPQTVIGTGTRAGHPDISYREWVEIGEAQAAACGAVLRLPGESPGAERECRVARSFGVPVFDTVKEVVEWAKTLKKGTDLSSGAEAVAAAVGLETTPA